MSQSSQGRGGRPKGAKTSLNVPVMVKRQLLKEMTERALVQHDHIAQDQLFLFLLKGEANA